MLYSDVFCVSHLAYQDLAFAIEDVLGLGVGKYVLVSASHRDAFIMGPFLRVFCCPSGGFCRSRRKKGQHKSVLFGP